MKQLEKLIERIIDRVNINLREAAVDVGPYLRRKIFLTQLQKFYAFYGITPQHSPYFRFRNSNLAGSYFFGRCTVDHSVIYKTDVRGDELKSKGDTFSFHDKKITLLEDENVRIKDSFLIKTLVHNNSHDPESPEEFLIRNTVSMHYANIHGAPMEGCFLEPFSTVDLTTLHNCVIGAFAYVQVGEISHQQVEPGRIWIKNKDIFEFNYIFPQEVLGRYVAVEPGKKPGGMFMDFAEARKTDFQGLFDVVHLKAPVAVPKSASLNRYAVIRGNSHISENVLVAQRAYLENAWLGKGANAQENCYIIDSRLEGENVTAHGGTIIQAALGEKVFVGFNSFLQGKPDCPLTVGKNSIIMPHTIIDLVEPLNIPPAHIAWGYITNSKDLKEHSLSLETFSGLEGAYTSGNMRFRGSGARFVQAFQHRIDHILEENGAFFDGKNKRGHAQKK
ncbi:MAG: transferase, partial [Proteobacteria bacterium]|nr:transferase [Pseudomonadota bacterium]